MAPKKPGDEQARPTKKDDGTQPGAAPDSNVIFPPRYTERLKHETTESSARLREAKRRALESIDRDLERLARNDHALDPKIVDQFVTLLKTARQELAQTGALTVEQAEYLQATGRRLEALVEQVKQGTVRAPEDTCKRCDC